MARPLGGVVNWICLGCPVSSGTLCASSVAQNSMECVHTFTGFGMSATQYSMGNSWVRLRCRSECRALPAVGIQEFKETGHCRCTVATAGTVGLASGVPFGPCNVPSNLVLRYWVINNSPLLLWRRRTGTGPDYALRDRQQASAVLSLASTTMAGTQYVDP